MDYVFQSGEIAPKRVDCYYDDIAVTMAVTGRRSRGKAAHGVRRFAGTYFQPQLRGLIMAAIGSGELLVAFFLGGGGGRLISTFSWCLTSLKLENRICVCVLRLWSDVGSDGMHLWGGM